MNILVTGSKGFIGRNLLSVLGEQPHTIWQADADTSSQDLVTAASQADFVFHFAGVNRPKEEQEFQQGNGDFTRQLLHLLTAGKRPPVLMTSSTQATLENAYGRSKRSAEDALLAYANDTGAPVFLYRLTNVFGKWSRPNYNSAVATFCYQIARGLPIRVDNPQTVLRLNYIDDVVAECLRALQGAPTREGEFCAVHPVHEVTLERLVELLHLFHSSRARLDVVDQSEPFTRKLYATYLSFLPEDDFAKKAVMHADARGSFTELLHMAGYGQVSVNISRPGITKGDHWHHTKNEKFIVVSGCGVIRFRLPASSEIISYAVSGNEPSVVDIPPGYTHNIENLGETDLITIMWANECFDPNAPDTYRLPVLQERNAEL